MRAIQEKSDHAGLRFVVLHTFGFTVRLYLLNLIPICSNHDSLSQTIIFGSSAVRPHDVSGRIGTGLISLEADTAPMP